MQIGGEEIMIKYFTTVSFCTLFALFFGCQNSPTEPPVRFVAENIIMNPSFEDYYSQPTLIYWDTTVSVKYSNDTPPLGGNWSAKLSTYDHRFLNPIFISPLLFQNIQLPKGSHIFTFSFWGKLDSSNYCEADLQIFKSDSCITKSVYVCESFWKQYTISDTLFSTSADSVSIVFWPGDSIFGKGNVLVDLCSLTAK